MPSVFSDTAGVVLNMYVFFCLSYDRVCWHISAPPHSLWCFMFKEWCATSIWIFLMVHTAQLFCRLVITVIIWSNCRTETGSLHGIESILQNNISLRNRKVGGFKWGHGKGDENQEIFWSVPVMYCSVRPHANNALQLHVTVSYFLCCLLLLWMKLTQSSQNKMKMSLF